MDKCKGAAPGPGQYCLPPLVGYKGHDPSRYRGPAYSLGRRPADKKAEVGPGPQYCIDQVTRFGKVHTPHYTILGRQTYNKSSITPGPGAYCPEQHAYPKSKRAPAYTMLERREMGVKSITPGPNQYCIKSSLGTGCIGITLKSRIPINTKAFGPEPATYCIPPTNVYKKRPPAIGIRGRGSMGKGTTLGPGPAAYCIAYNTGPNPPKFSFGTKHGFCAPPYVTNKDTDPCVEAPN